VSDNLRLWSYIERIRDCKTDAELDWIARAVDAFRGSSRITVEQTKRLIEHGKRKRKELAATREVRDE
jgi:hypothetical protein